MKKNLFKSLQTLLVFGLAFTLTSCWNFDNPLEEMSGSGSGSGDGGGSSTIAVTGVKLNEAYLRFDKNVLTAQTLTATVAPDDATDKTVTWESSDESVATVDENGQVTPITKGTVTITATANDGSGMKATSTVIVYDKIHNINTDGAASVTSGEEWLIEGNGTAISNSITIGDGATVTLNGINISQQITCSGNATIYLADDSENKVVSTNLFAGIKIGGDGTTLTINAETAGTGKLTAKGGGFAAGIGTGVNQTGGNITINGGTVTATGGEWGAGIGTGSAYFDNNKCGVITIKGGTVNATGGDSGAGIGTGDACSDALSGSGDVTAECGNIIIDGGTVNAKGGSAAAGIGTGQTYSTNLGETASQTCGAITIGTGVTSVIATKGSGAPNSIGVGVKLGGGGTENQTCGTITFGSTQVFDGASPGTWDAGIDFNTDADYGPYGGLNLNISTTTNANDTWTLTPVAP